MGQKHKIIMKAKKKLINLVFTLLFIFVLSCSRQSIEQKSIVTPLTFDIQQVNVDGDYKAFQLNKIGSEPEKGLFELKLRFTSKELAKIPSFKLKWRVPSNDIYTIWSPNIDAQKANFGFTLYSRMGAYAPIFSMVNSVDINRITFYSSEVVNTLETKVTLSEEDGFFYCETGVFTNNPPDHQVKEYEIAFRFDIRSDNYNQSLNQAAIWWDKVNKIVPMKVSEFAQTPLYSTWYSYHTKISAANIIKECKLAKNLGYNGVIVDAGWQGRDNSILGDWRNEGIPDIKAMVDSLHGIRMKAMLWMAIPFYHEGTDFAKLVGNRKVRSSTDGAFVFDPRYPDLRQTITDKMIKPIKEWGFDGLKIDFVDNWYPNPGYHNFKGEGRDQSSFDSALVVLMENSISQLGSVNPDLAIEFRQAYATPYMRKYGNMYRAIDCANAEILNRVYTVKLRQIYPSIAVHADMWMWNYDEPAEKAASQILSTLFAVPQLSVRIAEMSENHIKMIKHWTNYWKQHRQVLLYGQIEGTRPAENFPVVSSSFNDTCIMVAYGSQFVEVQGDKFKTIHIVNATGHKSLIIKVKSDNKKSIAFEIFDTYGTRLDNGKKGNELNIYELSIPESGYVIIR